MRVASGTPHATLRVATAFRLKDGCESEICSCLAASVVATAFRLKDGCEEAIDPLDVRLVQSQPPFG